MVFLKTAVGKDFFGKTNIIRDLPGFFAYDTSIGLFTGLHSELRAPLAAAAGDHLFAIRRAVSLQKAVCSSTFALFWLIGSLHGGIVARDISFFNRNRSCWFIHRLYTYAMVF